MLKIWNGFNLSSELLLTLSWRFIVSFDINVKTIQQFALKKLNASVKEQI